MSLRGLFDPKLQNGEKLPKWTRKSALGVHLGTSTFHSETIGRILNLATGHISPQYHVVYDELYTSVRGALTHQAMNSQVWHDMLRLGGEEALLDPPSPEDPAAPPPPPRPPPSPPPSSGSRLSVPEGDDRVVEPSITEVTDALETLQQPEGAEALNQPELIDLPEAPPGQQARPRPKPSRSRRAKPPTRAQPSRSARGDHRSN